MSVKSAVTASFLLAVFLCEVHAKMFSSATEVVYGVKIVNRCNCVLVIARGNLENSKTVTLSHHLGARNIFILLSEITQLDKALADQRKHCSHPLVVFFEDFKDRRELIKLSRKAGFSVPTWLLFLESVEQPESALRDINIAFDCKFLVARFVEGQDVSITEVYRVAPHLPLEKHPFGGWRPGVGFTGPKLELFSRRNNLRGIVLRVSTLDDPPLTILNPNKTNEIEGYYGKLWQQIARKINFTMQVIPPANGSYGVRLPNGSWDGVMGQIQRNEVDLAVTGTAISTYRMEVPKFSVALYTLQFAVFLREPEGFVVSWHSILSPFTPPLWAAVLMTAFAASIFLSHLYKFDRRFNLQTDRRKVSLYDTFFFVFGAIFCQQSHDQNPRSLACRVVYVVAYLCGTILVGNYSAMLISFLTVFIPKMPFTDLEGLLADTSYTLGAKKDASVIGYFQETRDRILNDLYIKKIVPGLRKAPLSHYEGFQRVCDEKYAHIGATQLLAKMLKNVTCLIFQLPTPVNQAHGGYATYPKNSPYAGIFDHTMLDFYQAGIIQRVVTLNYGVPPHPRSTLQSLTFQSVAPFLSIIFVGILLALTFVILERLTSFKERRWGDRNLRHNRVC